jgi:hypothetical protein
MAEGDFPLCFMHLPTVYGFHKDFEFRIVK